MRITRLLAILPALLVLGACGTTTAQQSQTFATQYTGTLKFTAVKADCSVSDAPVQLADELRKSVMSGLSNGPQGTKPVEVDLHIVSYRVVPASERYMLSVLAGANNIDVMVTVKDASGTELEKFDINRSETHESIGGVLTDSMAELVNDATQGIVFALSGQALRSNYTSVP